MEGTIRGSTYKLVNFNTRAPKYPAIAIKDGKDRVRLTREGLNMIVAQYRRKNNAA